MTLGSTQPLIEMSNRIISWGGKSDWCVRLTVYHHPVWSGNLGALTSRNPLGPSGLVTGLIYLKARDHILHPQICDFCKFQYLTFVCTPSEFELSAVLTGGS